MTILLSLGAVVLPPPLLGFLFSTPGLTLGIAGAVLSVPVLIHLLNRRRHRVVDWAAMRFLLAAQKKNVRRLRLEQWFLLATRMLLLLLLVLALASITPWAERLWQRWFPAGLQPLADSGRTHHILVLDGSLSLGAQRDGQTRFDWARQQAEEILREAPVGDGFSLVFLSNPAEVIVPGPADDPEKVLEYLRKLELPHGIADLSGGMEQVADLVARSPAKFARREVIFFSDLQRSSWNLPSLEKSEPTGVSVPEASPAQQLGLSRAWRQIARRARVVFVDLAGTDSPNLAITDVRLNEPLVLTNVTDAVTATVNNFSPVEQPEVRVSLLIGKLRAPNADAALVDRPLAPIAMTRQDERVVPIPAGASLPVSFPIRFPTPGQYVLQVRLDSDILELDNTRTMAVMVRNQVPVLVVNGKPAPEPLARGSEWLKRALNPFPERVRLTTYPAQPKVLSRREFADVRLGDLNQASTVFFCDMPGFTSNEIARLEAHLRRGGNIVFGLGPNAAKHLTNYNTLLYSGGKGILPVRFTEVVRAQEGSYFTLYGDESSFQQAPLSAFRADDERASLATARFQAFVGLEPLPRETPVRTRLRFVPGEPSDPNASARRLAPALLEWSKLRGKVLLFTSSFNTDWNSWPLSPSFLPLLQEVFRTLEAGNQRQSILVGEPIQDYLSIGYVGLNASVRFPDGENQSVPIVGQNDAAFLLLSDTTQSGIYQTQIGTDLQTLYAVNVPLVTSLGGSESALDRIDATELQGAAPDADLVVVEDVTDIPAPRRLLVHSGESHEAEPIEPRGPAIARLLLLCVLGLMLLEMILAWRFGAARSSPGTIDRGTPSRWGWLLGLSWLLILLVLTLLATLVHAEWSGQFLGFLPNDWLSPLERYLEVPEAAPGEGTEWRLGYLPFLTGQSITDRWLVAGLGLTIVLFILVIYRLEYQAVGSSTGTWLWHRLLPVALLRISLFVLLLCVLLPQLRLFFDRESWPDVVLLIDDSRSMSKIDAFTDPEVQARAKELAALEGLPEANRLQLAQALVLRGETDWLTRLLQQRRVKVHVYHVAAVPELLGEVSQIDQVPELVGRIAALRPEGNASELGRAIRSILKSFRGGSLASVILLSDGVICHERNYLPTSAGEDEFTSASQFAARMGVPLFLVGIGDAVEPFDLILSDLQVDDVVRVGDRLVFEARLALQGSAKGPDVADQVPIILYEKNKDTWVERTREQITVDHTGKPVKVRLLYAPEEAGEKVYRLAVAEQAEERITTNNRLQRTILVTEAKRLRVLYIEGYPRYEYRYIKTLLERELASEKGTRSLELRVVQLDADEQHFLQDRTVLSGLPTRQELYENYDVVILGDVDPRGQLANSDANLEMLADFVRERGGGLLMIAGRQFAPNAYKDTPLADLLPIRFDVQNGAPGTLPDPDQTYHPQLTSIGQSHPLFRFAPDAAKNASIWNRLEPMVWFASGYRRKLSAEVLVTHPTRPAELGSEEKTQQTPSVTFQEKHPLVLQQFVGSGRVMFFGLDETWRWRKRENYPYFNQFWIQCVRSLARNRLGRTEIRLDRQTPYRENEPIRVTVRFPDDAPPPEETTRVKVLAERFAKSPGENRDERSDKEREVQTLELRQLEGTRATYEMLLTRTPIGSYRFRLIEPIGPGTPPTAEAQVLPPAAELDQLQMNVDGLQTAAQQSQGKFYRLAQANNLVDDLPDGPRVALNQPRPPWAIWNQSFILIIIICIFVVEWIARKQWRLV